MILFDPSRPVSSRPEGLLRALGFFVAVVCALAAYPFFSRGSGEGGGPCFPRVEGGLWRCGAVAFAAEGLTPAQARVLGLPLDLNAASSADLEPIKGLGPGRVSKILALREALGGFCALSDLGEVAGIGPKTLQKLSKQLVVNPSTSPGRCAALVPAQVTSHITP